MKQFTLLATCISPAVHLQLVTRDSQLVFPGCSLATRNSQLATLLWYFHRIQNLTHHLLTRHVLRFGFVG